jgi:ATP-binding cassette subfamily B protein
VFLFLGIELAEPYVYKLIIDRLSDFLSGKAQDLRFLDFVPMIGAWFGIVFANLGIKWGYDYWTYRIFYQPNRRASLAIATEFFRLPYHYHVSVDTSEKTKIASRGSDAVYEINHLVVAKVFPSAVLFLGLVCVGFFVHPKMALASLALLPIFAAISMFIGSRAHVIQKDINHLWDKYYGRLGDAFSNVLVLKTYGREKKELAIIDSKIVSALERQYKINVLWAFLEAGTGLMGFINRTVILGF